MVHWEGSDGVLGGSTNYGHEYTRGPDVGLARSAEGGVYLFKNNELLTAYDDLADVQALLRAWGEPTPPGGSYRPARLAQGSQWVRLTLGPDSTRVPRLVADLRAQERPGTKLTFRVSPNHVLRGNYHGSWGPASPPSRAGDPLATPPPDTPSEEPIRIALFDTGEAIKHEWFNGRVERLATSPIPDQEEPPEPLPRYVGHSTFVAGLVLQHAPHARILVEWALDSYGEISDTDLAAAIRRLPADINILHLSCAGATAFNIGLPATQEALAELRERNPKIVVVAPAGNGSTDTPWYPGAFKGVVCVGALGAEPTKAGFSNWGPWVDVSAPGLRAKSTFLSCTRTPEQTDVLPGVPPLEHPGEKQVFAGWAYWSGTSFAAARVTGAIAQLAAESGIGVQQAAFELFGDGRRRRNDSGFDLGALFFPSGWA